MRFIDSRVGKIRRLQIRPLRSAPCKSNPASFFPDRLQWRRSCSDAGRSQSPAAKWVSAKAGGSVAASRNVLGQKSLVINDRENCIDVSQLRLSPRMLKRHGRRLKMSGQFVLSHLQGE
jgi:hypothetical protein